MKNLISSVVITIDWNSLDISINSKKNFPFLLCLFFVVVCFVFLTIVVPDNYRTRPLLSSNTVAINKTEFGNVLLTTSSLPAELMALLTTSRAVGLENQD